jgi:SAM-dependent methyltransferase
MSGRASPRGTDGPASARWAGRRFYEPPYVRTNVLFFDWVRSRLKPTDTVLDAGAGLTPGDPARNLRGTVAKVCGIDVDEAVLTNDALDEARVVRGDRWPYPDASFDVVLSDYVLEHLEFPDTYVAEVRRVLKSGGFFFFRTVNAHHPISVLVRLVPFALRSCLIRRFNPGSADAHEPYTTYFRANTRTRVVRLLRQGGFRNVDLRAREEPPIYLAAAGPGALVGVLWERVANKCPFLAPLRVTLYGCAR